MPDDREELERALRRMTAALESVRDDVLQLAAKVVALEEELTRRDATIEPAVAAATPEVLQQIRITDEGSTQRVLLGDALDKYTTPPSGPNCTEILPICQGRCCKNRPVLSTQDLDEGVIRWDYGRPYLVKERVEDGYCTHNDPVHHGCTVYQHRPRPCRTYDCRTDERIWVDFDKKILATGSAYATKVWTEPDPIDLVAQVRARQTALAMEGMSVAQNLAARRNHRDPDED